ncbi:MAG: LacI family DNA-binding transcriptional regulator [Lachnospiraceae bacterium]|nr:LacI family DNA-binding transcriptional regulator [Lachnospiraceae bacterium]
MPTSIREVARHAGVSIATVSHVINNTRYVKEETRKKVQDSIEQLGYCPNAIARSFKTGRHNLIAFITPDIANPFYSAMIEEVEAVISAKGYRLLICNTKEDAVKEADALRVLANGVVDGFIIASAFLSYDPIAKMLPANLPVIFVDRSLENNPCDTLLIDNYHALQKGIEYLIHQGHTHIAYITVKNQLSTVIERRAAYEDTMASHHLPTDDLVFIANPLSSLFSDNLAPLLREDITAIAVPNACLSTEVLTFLEEHGRIPGKDIEAIGYKESNQPQYINPSISLISQPAEALGRAAGHQLLERMSNPDLPTCRTILSATFIPKTDRHKI